MAYSNANRAKIGARLRAEEAAGVVRPQPRDLDAERRRTHSVPARTSERGVSVPRVGLARPTPPAPITRVPHRARRPASGSYERERAPPGLPTQSSDEKKAALAAQNARAGKSESEAAEEKLSDVPRAAPPIESHRNRI